MSRSYKHEPVYKDHSKGMKTIAARRLRRKPLEAIPNGGGYKKFFDPYNISDWSTRKTLNEELTSYRDLYDRELTDEEKIRIANDWKRNYVRK